MDRAGCGPLAGGCAAPLRARRRPRRALLRRGRQRLQRLCARHARASTRTARAAAVRLVVRHGVQEPAVHLRRHPAGEAARLERLQRPPRRGAVRHRHRARGCSSSAAPSSVRGSASGRRCSSPSPWHLHFSRIAFELIAFPFSFVTGCALLVRFTQGRRTLPAALACSRSCVYAYAPAAMFVPAFLLGFGVLYSPICCAIGASSARARRRGAVLAPAGGVLQPPDAAAARCTSAAPRSRSRSSRGGAARALRDTTTAQFFSPRFLMHERRSDLPPRGARASASSTRSHSLRPARRRHGAAAPRPRQQADAVVAGALPGRAEPDERDPQRDARHHRRAGALPAGRHRLRRCAARAALAVTPSPGRSRAAAPVDADAPRRCALRRREGRCSAGDRRGGGASASQVGALSARLLRRVSDLRRADARRVPVRLSRHDPVHGERARQLRPAAC